MIISSTLAALYLLVCPILEFVDSVYGSKFAGYRSFFLYLFVVFVVFEFLKQAYRWGKQIQYHTLPESTFVGEIFGCGFLFTGTIFVYVALVSTFILNSTQRIGVWNFTKKYPYMILFCYFVYRAYGLMQSMYKLGMKISSAPVTADKTHFKVVLSAAVLFHCQMLIHELYTWRAFTMLGIIFAVALLCFDTLTNFDYMWDSAQRAVMALFCQGVFRSILLMYCNLCDRASSYLFQDKTADLGYPSYCFI